MRIVARTVVRSSSVIDRRERCAESSLSSFLLALRAPLHPVAARLAPPWEHRSLPIAQWPRASFPRCTFSRSPRRRRRRPRRVFAGNTFPAWKRRFTTDLARAWLSLRQRHGIERRGASSIVRTRFRFTVPRELAVAAVGPFAVTRACHDASPVTATMSREAKRLGTKILNSPQADAWFSSARRPRYAGQLIDPREIPIWLTSSTERIDTRTRDRVPGELDVERETAIG